ncbi:hypothetical protein B0H14DRAFT_3167340 [Mycena olivaceomarginata]|nr:hypothetical protein B0H14DRAFT_3167340 [Mycena olivaceomarginata]
MLVTSRTSPERTEEELADREYNEGEDDKRSAGVDARQQGLQGGSDAAPDHDARPAVDHIEREPVIHRKPAKHEAVDRQEPANQFGLRNGPIEPKTSQSYISEGTVPRDRRNIPGGGTVNQVTAAKVRGDLQW